MKAKLSQIVVLIALGAFATFAGAQSPVDINNATLTEVKQKTPNISTEELRKILSDKSATVFDVRSSKEYSIDHIPGVINVAVKSKVAEIGRILKGNKAAPIVLYCNGPFCGKSKKVAKKLVAAGYTNVRRYQLGIPVWRALGGITEIELKGVRYVVGKDQTAVLIDVRDPKAFNAGTLPNARNLPQSLVKPGKGGKEVKKAKKDGRLPVKDHNARIIVFGRDGTQAKPVAKALTRNAFYNVSYFPGTFKALQEALK